jgi:pimeloyl-ACP methyl ester carboxylesterase
VQANKIDKSPAAVREIDILFSPSRMTDPQLLSIQCLLDTGSGRAVVLLNDEVGGAFFQNVVDAISVAPRKLAFSIPEVNDSNWKVVGDTFQQVLEAKGVRQAIFVGVGSATIPLLYATLLDPKRTRQLVLIDPASRPQAGFLDRVAGMLERHLPLGLPLRSRSSGFDVGSFLQRLRCPVLVLSTAQGAGAAEVTDYFCSRLPTAWGNVCSSPVEIVDRINEFLQVPVKASQKSRG